jgi:hypothetical protein
MLYKSSNFRLAPPPLKDIEFLVLLAILLLRFSVLSSRMVGTPDSFGFRFRGVKWGHPE